MKKKALFITATMLALTMSTATLISGCGCSGPSTATSDEAVQIETKIETVTEIATDEQGNTHIEEVTEIVEIKSESKSESKSEEKSESEKSENSDSESSKSTEKKQSSSSVSNTGSSKTEDKATKSNSTSSSGKTNSSTSANSTNKTSSSSNSNNSTNKTNSSSKSDTSSKTSSSSSSKQESSKVEETKHTHTWENITKSVKVVDQEAYSYEEPVYEYKVRTICKVCGEDITGNTTVHNKQHVLNGENVSYEAKKVKTQIDTKIVEVPEKSHYEDKVIGRKCTSCGTTEYY